MLHDALDMPQKSEPPKISRTDELGIASAASCDPRTVRRALAGEAVRPMVLDRIRRALAERHLEHLLPGK